MAGLFASLAELPLFAREHVPRQPAGQSRYSIQLRLIRNAEV